MLAVAGPGLPGARREVGAVGELYPGASVLVDPASTVAAVTEGLRQAGIAHLAAHGNFRADNPLFSSLRLADGPLTVYDLQALPRVPELVVLAACDSGQSLVCAGDELLGLAAAFLTLGSRALLATVIPVPDAEAEPLMVAVHRGLRRGQSLAEALTLAQAELSTAAGPALAASAGFVCLGAGLDARAPLPDPAAVPVPRAGSAAEPAGQTTTT